uniref:Uncharacterized protein n=1 Tax=Lactuca sativa TaxID=4236 RepID=A0A9R1VBZ4_LACSA|nr:hypothetical protein LSAT_V11C500294020 [Lactuca sativa]
MERIVEFLLTSRIEEGLGVKDTIEALSINGGRHHLTTIINLAPPSHQPRTLVVGWTSNQEFSDGLVVLKSEYVASNQQRMSIANLNPNVNKKLSAAVAEILSSKLSVPKSHLFLKFFDSQVTYRTLTSVFFLCHYVYVLILIVFFCFDF